MNDTTQAGPGALVRAFVDVFRAKDAALFADFVHPDVVFRNYGDSEVRGRDALVRMWAGVFGNFEVVRFETVHQAVDGDVVLAEQIHHLGLPGGPRRADHEPGRLRDQGRPHRRLARLHQPRLRPPPPRRPLNGRPERVRTRPGPGPAPTGPAHWARRPGPSPIA